MAKWSFTMRDEMFLVFAYDHCEEAGPNRSFIGSFKSEEDAFTAAFNSRKRNLEVYNTRKDVWTVVN